MPAIARNSIRGPLLGSVALFLLAGCGARDSSSADAIATFTLTTRAGITDYAVDPDPLKRAAADYFRDVAIKAPDEAAARLAARVRDALYSEKGVHHSLDIKVRAAIEPQLAALAAAAARSDRRQTALTALEAYRLLTEDLSTAGKVPSAMALIDYAQLVGAAQLRSARPDWQALDAALALADRKWREVSQALTDPQTGNDMAHSLAELTRAAQRRDARATQAALVAARPSYDRLTLYFNRTRAA